MIIASEEVHNGMFVHIFVIFGTEISREEGPLPVSVFNANI
jgi:hypothetical protein